jgi:hypothetical protein
MKQVSDKEDRKQETLLERLKSQETYLRERTSCFMQLPFTEFNGVLFKNR